MTLPHNAPPPAVASSLKTPPSAMTGSSSPLGGIRSMTGFAQYTTVLPNGGKLTLEMRAVNSRFLDLTLKLPDSLRPMESAWRTLMSQRIKRGKVELKASHSDNAFEALPTSLDSQVLEVIAALSSQAKAKIDGFQGPTLTEILTLQDKWAGNATRSNLQNDSSELSAISTAYDLALEQIIGDFEASRASEGHRLSGVVLEAMHGIRRIAERLLQDAPAYVEQARLRLAARLSAALDTYLIGDETAERIRQEVAALGLKADVAEEINRVLIHCEELGTLMQPSKGKAKESGKRLDFLCQELNREANTLGSKAVSIELTNASIELKLLIEQIREQAQNFE